VFSTALWKNLWKTLSFWLSIEAKIGSFTTRSALSLKEELERQGMKILYCFMTKEVGSSDLRFLMNRMDWL
jgi:hypothetical protein